jgi:hypothetical protein
MRFFLGRRTPKDGELPDEQHEPCVAVVPVASAEIVPRVDGTEQRLARGMSMSPPARAP